MKYITHILGIAFLVASMAANAEPITSFFTGSYRIFTGIPDVSSQNDFIASQNSLGLDIGFIDFETLPDGSPTLGNTDGGRFPSDQYPVRYDSGFPTAVSLSSTISQTADLALPSDANPVISQTHVSPFFALSANGAFDGTAEIFVDFAEPVSAAGIWLTGVDDFLAGPDARVTWFFEDGSSLSRTSDTAGRVVNQFFGIIAHEDESRSTAFDSIVRMSFRQLGGNFNQADNLIFGLLPTVSAKPVDIDIKPGSDPNSINLKSKGKIPVAVLTTDTFDAIQVDPSTVAFGPDGAAESHGRSHIKDIDKDGDADLILHFKTQETGIQCGDTEATLTGETFGGQAITGTDAIRTVKCH